MDRLFEPLGFLAQWLFYQLHLHLYILALNKSDLYDIPYLAAQSAKMCNLVLPLSLVRLEHGDNLI